MISKCTICKKGDHLNAPTASFPENSDSAIFEIEVDMADPLLVKVEIKAWMFV